ncbi:DUF6894 family protein [Microvirga massiliensis]|uniref:DUF6894 family protein n=1 Tax=Microvirga massiliensis TaxID=1033741 RepID=UPI00062B9702|nr:hypothetical protein [Microvirga massiliensis]
MARFYFHLVGAHDVIPDKDGLEVGSLAETLAEVLKAIEELRRDNPSTSTEWRGWRLDVADQSGAVAFSINLDRFLQ